MIGNSATSAFDAGVYYGPGNSDEFKISNLPLV